MNQTVASKSETVGEAGLLSAAECARLCGMTRRVPSAELNEQIVKFLGYLYEGFKRGGSPWAQFEAELRAVYSEREPNASDCAVLHPANRKDLS
jgi:hypothetical protein